MNFLSTKVWESHLGSAAVPLARTETARCLEQGLIHIYSIHNLDSAFLNWKSLIYIYIMIYYIYIWYIYIYIIHDMFRCITAYLDFHGISMARSFGNRYGGRPNIEFPLARSPAERARSEEGDGEVTDQPTIPIQIEPLKIPWLIDCYRGFNPTWFTGDYDNP